MTGVSAAEEWQDSDVSSEDVFMEAVPSKTSIKDIWPQISSTPPQVLFGQTRAGERWHVGPPRTRTIVPSLADNVTRCHHSTPRKPAIKSTLPPTRTSSPDRDATARSMACSCATVSSVGSARAGQHRLGTAMGRAGRGANQHLPTTLSERFSRAITGTQQRNKVAKLSVPRDSSSSHPLSPRPRRLPTRLDSALWFSSRFHKRWVWPGRHRVASSVSDGASRPFAWERRLLP